MVLPCELLFGLHSVWQMFLLVSLLVPLPINIQQRSLEFLPMCQAPNSNFILLHPTVLELVCRLPWARFRWRQRLCFPPFLVDAQGHPDDKPAAVGPSSVHLLSDLQLLAESEHHE